MGTFDANGIYIRDVNEKYVLEKYKTADGSESHETISNVCATISPTDRYINQKTLISQMFNNDDLYYFNPRGDGQCMIRAMCCALGITLTPDTIVKALLHGMHNEITLSPNELVTLVYQADKKHHYVLILPDDDISLDETRMNNKYDTYEIIKSDSAVNGHVITKVAISRCEPTIRHMLSNANLIDLPVPTYLLYSFKANLYTCNFGIETTRPALDHGAQLYKLKDGKISSDVSLDNNLFKLDKHDTKLKADPIAIDSPNLISVNENLSKDATSDIMLFLSDGAHFKSVLTTNLATYTTVMNIIRANTKANAAAAEIGKKIIINKCDSVKIDINDFNASNAILQKTVYQSDAASVTTIGTTTAPVTAPIPAPVTVTTANDKAAKDATTTKDATIGTTTAPVTAPVTAPAPSPKTTTKIASSKPRTRTPPPTTSPTTSAPTSELATLTAELATLTAELATLTIEQTSNELEVTKLMAIVAPPDPTAHANTFNAALEKQTKNNDDINKTKTKINNTEAEIATLTLKKAPTSTTSKSSVTVKQKCNCMVGGKSKRIKKRPYIINGVHRNRNTTIKTRMFAKSVRNGKSANLSNIRMGHRRRKSRRRRSAKRNTHRKSKER